MQPYRTLVLLLCLMAPGFAIPCLSAEADNGAKTFVESCSPCHSATVRPLDNIHMVKEQWQETIDRMIDLGAEVPKAKRAELLDYLTRTHGPIGNRTDMGK